jgi:hypothetical protein
VHILPARRGGEGQREHNRSQNAHGSQAG